MQPTKEQVRVWLHEQVAEHKPVPDQATIRRELGWELIEANRDDIRIESTPPVAGWI